MNLRPEKMLPFPAKFCYLLIFLIFLSTVFYGQETNSHVSGLVRTEKNEMLKGATVLLVHEPTKNIYQTQTNAKGFFYFFNIKPGGPYTITITYTGFSALSQKDLFLSYSSPGFYSYLQDNEFSEFILKEKTITLDEVSIQAVKPSGSKLGAETNIARNKIQSMPSISRNFQDFVRLVPQAKVNGNGSMSLAGQNGKFNAFYIDGASYNDLLGLAQSGTTGGQTGSPPISIEAIEEIKVSLAPYSVHNSHFTGGSINAITRSGTNSFQSSAWYYFRNEQMAGRSPVATEIPGMPGIYKRQRLSPFFNQTAGAWASGPLVKNKLFYFFLAEKQQERQPQPFIFSSYRGISSQQQVSNLADTVRRRYGYEPGSFLETLDELNTTRFVLKLDWSPSQKNKWMFSYRFNNADRTLPQGLNGSTLIRFSNNEYNIESQSHSIAAEWSHFFKNNANNRLLLTCNTITDDRNFIGQPFPIINITDGAANIILGSNGTGQVNLFKASEWNLLNIFHITRKRHVVSGGVDAGFSFLKDIALVNYFGSYNYRSINDFFTDAYASRFSRNVSLADKPTGDETRAASIFNTLRTGAFLNDEIHFNSRLRLTAGIRIDGNSLPSSYTPDDFFNSVALPEILKYYDLGNAADGRAHATHWQLSPRIGFDYKLPKKGLTIRGGAGIFLGRIINLWASEIYRVNTATLNIAPQLYGLRFNPDPYNQPDFQSLGIDPEKSKGNKALVTQHYKYPAVFRTSFAAIKSFGQEWQMTTEFLFSKNLHETNYQNVNLLPASKQTPVPDSRLVYSLNILPERIPMQGGNPYSGIYLMGNKNDKTGFSYSFTAAISKDLQEDFQFNAAYTFGHSVGLFDAVGTANTISGQWEQRETVNGKNLAARSVSDFDLGHRFFVMLSKKISYGKNKFATLLTLFYNGQTGNPFSYVYTNSMINDNGLNSNGDLIYIPTERELNTMSFLPISVNNITYQPDEQKILLNTFIEQDKYLRKHRGDFAGRNDARLPFNHTIDFRIRQDIKIRVHKKQTVISLIYDVFNFTNMLNKNWGHNYFLSGDNFPLIRFAGFANTSTLTPQYQYIPVNGTPWSLQTSTAPGNNSRWISQLGIKFHFN
jgi:hypothetical protein